MLSVTREVDGDTGILNIDTGTIWYMEYDRHIDRIVVHTQRSMYYMTGTLKYWKIVLNNSGLNFALVDRNALININNIIEIDTNYRDAYFDEVKSKVCTLARHKFADNIKDLKSKNPYIQFTTPV
ncbi:LytTR family transcriptional regulator DNA-binding domain-containing protein [Paenibacillus wenxiniae]|uniref:LytTR family transcriptional regulator DNA-binding domain-containing protein n=1 Tax=Paenibacillus wenxiniae TaxID=1636843 RepID=A0ABW4RMY0_9BACL